tara:strand:- start:842 stop:1438 length:597 start_codon:yes stop_codon:yes gene_type:complete
MEIPIFPLNGAILFPGTSLPLNIFEDRYIKMVDYALANNRLIGMIQRNENNNLYKIGCIGKIQNFSETSDGRYIISLEGKKCFKLKDEINSNHKFKLVKIVELENPKENIEDFNNKKKEFLINKYKKYLHFKKIDMDLKEIQSIDIFQILKFIVMVSPFQNIEKQMLLEVRENKIFYDKIISILELEIFNLSDKMTIN